MHRADDVYSLTDFKQNSTKHLRRLRNTGRAEILTVNGKAEVVVMAPETYDLLRGRPEEDVLAKLRVGLEQARAGLLIDGDEALRRRRERRAVRTRRRR